MSSANDDLEKELKGIIGKYNPSPVVSQKLWAEIVSNYSGDSRHYHNVEQHFAITNPSDGPKIWAVFFFRNI